MDHSNATRSAVELGRRPLVVRRRVRAGALAAAALTSILLLAATGSAHAETACNTSTMREDASSTWYPYPIPDNATVAYAAKSAVKQFQDRDHYEWGACGSIRYSDAKQRFDCSGLVWWAYHNAGREFTRRSAHGLYWTGAAYPTHENGRRVGLWERKPGDLLFWDANGDGTIEHVGMYLGVNRDNGVEEIVEAVNPTMGIRISAFANRQAGLLREVVRVVG